MSDLERCPDVLMPLPDEPGGPRRCVLTADHADPYHRGADGSTWAPLCWDPPEAALAANMIEEQSA